MNKTKDRINTNRQTKVRDGVKRTSLKPDLAQFLWAIWKITGVVSDSGFTELATNKAVSAMLEIDETQVRQRFNQTKQLGREYVETFDIIDGEHETGRYKFGYYLSPSLITLPRTAILILELLKYKNSEPHQIPKDNFIEFLDQKYDWGATFIKGRIDAAARHDYITNLTEDSIWRGVRCYREFKYIEIIAKENTSEYAKFKEINNG